MSAIQEEEGSGPDEDAHMDVIVQQSALGAVAKMVGFLLGFVVAFVMARYFGAEVYGEFKLTLAMANLLMTLSIGGFGAGLIKFLPFYRERRNPAAVWLIIRYAYGRGAIGAMLMAALLLLSRDWLAEQVFGIPALALGLAVAAGYLIPETAVRLTSSLYAAFRRTFWAAVHVDVTSRLIFLAGLAALVWWGRMDSWQVMIVYAAGETMVLLILLYRLRAIPLPPRAKLSNPDDRRRLRAEVWGYSWAMMMTATLGFILHRVDTLMLGYYLEARDVGVYGVATRLCALTNLITMASGRIVSSVAATLHARGDRDELQRLARSVTRWFVALVLPLWATTLFYAEGMMQLFGPEFEGGADALRILMTSSMLYVICCMAGPLLLAICGEERFLFRTNIVMVLLNILLNILLIPRWGIHGAAWATMSAHAVSGGWWMFHARRKVGIHVFERRSAWLLLNGTLSVAAAWGMALWSTHLAAGLLAGALLVLFNVALVVWTSGGAMDAFLRVLLQRMSNRSAL